MTNIRPQYWISLALALAALALCGRGARAVVNNVTTSASYACDGVATQPGGAGNVTFPYLDQANLIVTVTIAGSPLTLVIVTDYTLSLTSTSTTATLTLAAGSRCPNGATLKIKRVTPKKQPTIYKGQTQLNMPAFETSYDRAAMISQEGVSVTGPLVGNGADTNLSMPQASGSASGFLSAADWSTFNTATGNFVAGVLSGPHGGLGAVQPTCAAGQALTCNSTVCSCAATTITTDTSLTGNGSGGSPAGLALSHANTWLSPQTYTNDGTNGGVILTPTATPPAAPSNGALWVEPTDGFKVRWGGSWHTMLASGGSTTWPARKTATDASSYLYWSLDETALPLANGIAAQGASGNFDTAGNVNWTSFSALGMFNAGPYCVGLARCGSYASTSQALSPAAPISIWFWYKPMNSTCTSFDGLWRAYRTVGTWTSPFVAFSLAVNTLCVVSFARTTSATSATLSATPTVLPGVWNLLYAVYKADGTGTSACVGINGGGLLDCSAMTGGIDYNANAGPWGIGQAPANATTLQGQIDEVHVDTVARSSSYFQTIWTTATSQGGN